MVHSGEIATITNYHTDEMESELSALSKPKMYSSVEFTICVGGGTCQECTGVASQGSALHISADVSPIGAEITMRIAGREVSLGTRPLNLTLNDILDQTPSLVSDAADDAFSAWLWRDNVDAPRLYREALEHSEEFPPRVAWRLCAPPGVSFPNLPVEAMLGDRMNAPVVFRQVEQLTEPLSQSVGRFLPPIGVWNVAPVSFMPHKLLPQLRDVMAEYDAIVRRRMPTVEVLDVEYAFTRDRLRRYLRKAGETSIQVLHIMADIDRRTGRLKVTDGTLTAAELASMFVGANWSELQTIVISAFCDGGAASTIAWELLQMLPVSSAVAFQGELDLRNALYPFMETFYGALAAGLPIDNAVARARMGLRESDDVGTADVLAPVLFMRGDREPAEIRIGDPAVESILAATHTIAGVRESLEHPDVVRIAENMPESIARIHTDLQDIGQEHIDRLRRMREQSDRVLREAITTSTPAYSATAAIAGQLRKVLDMAPAPAPATSGAAPAPPPGIDWTCVVHRASRHIGLTKPAFIPGISTIDEAMRCRRGFTITTDADGASYRLCVPDTFRPEPDAYHKPDAVADIHIWPPSIDVVEYASQDQVAFCAGFERLLASAAAATVRDILTFHFALLLGQQQPQLCPAGFAPDGLLRGAFHTLGIRVEDVSLPIAPALPCPPQVYLLRDLDEGCRILTVMRTGPEAQAEGPEWDALQDFLQTVDNDVAPDGAMFLDPWPAHGVEKWLTDSPLARTPPTSWVWNQLPQAASDYRLRLTKRLWEWWIGALPPEGDHA